MNALSLFVRACCLAGPLLLSIYGLAAAAGVGGGEGPAVPAEDSSALHGVVTIQPLPCGEGEGTFVSFCSSGVPSRARFAPDSSGEVRLSIGGGDPSGWITCGSGSWSKYRIGRQNGSSAISGGGEVAVSVEVDNGGVPVVLVWRGGPGDGDGSFTPVPHMKSVHLAGESQDGVLKISPLYGIRASQLYYFEGQLRLLAECIAGELVPGHARSGSFSVLVDVSVPIVDLRPEDGAVSPALVWGEGPVGAVVGYGHWASVVQSGDAVIVAYREQAGVANDPERPGLRFMRYSPDGWQTIEVVGGDVVPTSGHFSLGRGREGLLICTAVPGVVEDEGGAQTAVATVQVFPVALESAGVVQIGTPVQEAEIEGVLIGKPVIGGGAGLADGAVEVLVPIRE